MSILIKNALIATQDKYRSIIRGNVLVIGDRIAYVGKALPKATRTIDGREKAVMPGLINTHTHVAMSHMKGLLDDVELGEFLERTFKYDSKRTGRGIYNSALLGMLEMAGSGTTSFLDLYYSEDIVAKAAKALGMRAFLSWVTLDEEFTTQKGSPIRNADRFISSNKGDSLIEPSVGVQGVYVANDETLLRAKELSERHGTILHMHLAETQSEVKQSLKSFGLRPVERIDRLGLIDRRLVAAHCVWLNRKEAKALGSKRANVSWNPVSNSKLASGVAGIKELLDAGANIAIGTDSNGSNNSLNMLESMKFGALQAKAKYMSAAALTAQQAFDMATVNAAKALGRADIGSIEPGKLADLAIIDISTPNMRPTNEANLINNIVYSANPSNIVSVMVGGRFLRAGMRLKAGLGAGSVFV